MLTQTVHYQTQSHHFIAFLCPTCQNDLLKTVVVKSYGLPQPLACERCGR